MHRLSWIAIAVQVAACALALVLYLRDDHNGIAQIVVVVGLLAGWILNMIGRRARRSRPPVVVSTELDGELRRVRERHGETAAVKRLRQTHRGLGLLEAVQHVRSLDPGQSDHV